MKKYIKTGTTLVFTSELKKLRGHWDAFVQYKSSELVIQKVQKAKDNTSKKVYHHTLGQGVYKLAIPKWAGGELNLTAAQIAGGEDIPKADVVVKWTYEIGKSLVPPK